MRRLKDGVVVVALAAAYMIGHAASSCSEPDRLDAINSTFGNVCAPEWPAVAEPTMDELPEWYRFRNELDACLDDMDPEFEQP